MIFSDTAKSGDCITPVQTLVTVSSNYSTCLAISNAVQKQTVKVSRR